MNAIDTDRSHSSNLTAQATSWINRWNNKGFASKTSALRSKNLAATVARIEAADLGAHFAFVMATEGKHAGRVVPTLGFEAGAAVPTKALAFIHYGITVIQAR